MLRDISLLKSPSTEQFLSINSLIFKTSSSVNWFTRFEVEIFNYNQNTTNNDDSSCLIPTECDTCVGSSTDGSGTLLEDGALDGFCDTCVDGVIIDNDQDNDEANDEAIDNQLIKSESENSVEELVVDDTLNDNSDNGDNVEDSTGSTESV